MTIDESPSAEQRIADLVEDVRRLGCRVDDLAARLLALEAGRATRLATALPPAAAAPATAATESEAVLGWVGRSHALQQIAVISFVLVVALLLRTLTDSRVLGLELGVVLGVLYSGLLIAWGSRRLARGRRPELLAACGGVLMCTVAMEAHRNFQVLSPSSVSWILLADLGVLTVVGLRWRSRAVLAVAALGTTVAALATDFPDPPFVPVATVLLAANLATVLAQRLPSTQWQRWVALLLTMFFWLLWSLKTRAAGQSPELAQPGLAATWFLPCAGAFALLFAVTAALRIARGTADAFDAFLPPANVVWSYGAAAVVLGRTAPRALGVVGLLVAVLHFAVAAVLWRLCRQGSTGSNVFLLAGTLLAVMAVPAVLDSQVFVLPVLASLAVGIAMAASASASAGLRASALLLQCLVAAVAVAGGLFAVPAAQPALHIAAAGALAMLALGHYRWTRVHQLPATTLLARFEAGSHASILLLWAAAAAAFGLLRLLAFGLLGAPAPADAGAFRCAQSVILNVSSIVLMLWGLRTREPQVLATAALVAVAGGLKVIGSDLLTASGVPLVVSVFSFGVAAAVGSVVLGRWQARRAAERGDGSGALSS
jgi:hypothetical protein